MSDSISYLLGWAFFWASIALPLTLTGMFWCGRIAKRAKAGPNSASRVFSQLFATVAGFFTALCLITIFWTFNQIKVEGTQYETDLNKQYVQNANILSTYVSSFEEQLGVANLQEAQIKAIITEAVAGQANVKNLVAPGSSPLFIAVKQAYPTVTLAQYNQLISYIQQGRQQFQDGQSKLLTQLSAYDNWQHTGFLIQPSLVYMLGFPTNLLHVDIGGKSLKGAAAEAQMWKIVENPTAVAAFVTGRMDALPVSK